MQLLVSVSKLRRNASNELSAYISVRLNVSKTRPQSIFENTFLQMKW